MEVLFMDRLLFGISGLPIGDGTTKFNYKSGITYLNNILRCHGITLCKIC